jgi:hypothetical protein
MKNLMKRLLLLALLFVSIVLWIVAICFTLRE